MIAQLKQHNREKQKRIRPIKQPTKSVRPPILLDKLGRTEEGNLRQTEKEGKGKIAPIAPEQHKVTTRQNICTELLEAGNVQSFVDLFYISHKCLPNVMEKKNYFGESLHIPEQAADEQSTLQFYSDFSQSLAKAEVRPESLRDQKQAAMNEYNSIAFNYEDQGDFVTASYFYQRVVDLAISCKNKQFELVALLGLGKCHDQGGKRDRAIQILEDGFDSACTLQAKEQRVQMTRLVGRQIIEIYIYKAQQVVKFDLNDALKAYESALNIAQRSGELDSEARISHKIGQLYYDEGKYDRSVDYQEQYLTKLKLSIENELVRQAEQGIERKEGQGSLKFKEMEAHASLAKCYLKLKDIAQAELHLNDYHRMAKDAKAQNSVADSSYYLAKLFQEKGDKDRSIAYYQSYFQAAKSQKQDKKDRRLVDKARVTFAVAKANKNMERYISLFEGQASLKAILDWKIKRVLR